MKAVCVVFAIFIVVVNSRKLYGRQRGKLLLDPFARKYNVPKHSLTFMSNGDWRFGWRQDLWDAHFRFLGLNRKEQIAYGKDALEFFNRQFGVNLTNKVTDNDILGLSTYEDEFLSFTATALDPATNFRLHTETMGKRCKVYEEARVSRSDWVVRFKKEFTPPFNSVYKRTISPGAILRFGDYFIPTVKEGALSGDNLLIHLETLAPTGTVLGTPTENGRSSVLNILVYNKKFGVGIARGVPAFSTQNPPPFEVAGRLVFTWPADSFEI